MGTPPNPDAWEAALHDFAGTTIQSLIRVNVPTDRKILDVGAGWGKYRLLLPEYTFDAVEVWAPEAEKNDLASQYDTVYITDIKDFTYPQEYGAIIMGDVLEHLSAENAQRVIDEANRHTTTLVVAVPFMMDQHAEEDNPYEEHLQNDLNFEVMGMRYPDLNLYEFDGHKAIYIS